MRFEAGLAKLCLAVLILNTVAVAALWAQDSADMELVDLETSLWEAWKNGDSGPFEQSLSDDTINYSGGELTIGKAGVIENIAGGVCDVESYSLDEVRVSYPAEGTAMLTYTASQEGVCDGQAIPSRVFATSLYVMQDGAWKAAYYHETPIDED